MNQTKVSRRSAIKKVIGVGVVAAVGIPASVKAEQLPSIQGPTSYTPPSPPPDLRSPEQVWMDDIEERAGWIMNDAVGHNPYRKTVLRLEPEIWERVKVRAKAELGIEPTKLFGQREVLVMNGRVITRFSS